MTTITRGSSKYLDIIRIEVERMRGIRDRKAISLEFDIRLRESGLSQSHELAFAHMRT